MKPRTTDLTAALGGHRADEHRNGHAPVADSLGDPFSTPPQEPWPTLEPEALHGLAGDFVRAVDPYTESDRVAVLVSFLAGFGNMIGAGVHAKAGQDAHPARFFVALVGDTAQGRKGMSWGPARDVLALADPDWAAARLAGGCSSGEGVIYHVRDAREEQQPIKEKRRVIGYETVQVDAGEPDKRLLVREPELASVLIRMEREGNSLSMVLREAWDVGPIGTLSTMTRNSPLRATGAHISIIGHITPDELRVSLRDTERANGFANRFLFLLVKRSKYLPDGPQVPLAELQRLADAVRRARDHATTEGELRRDADANELWRSVYRRLTAPRAGLYGAAVSRAEAQVLRASVAYAALDGASRIKVPHVKAALALWDYAEESARRIFGGSTGDAAADRLLVAIREAPGQRMSRTAMYDLFDKNIAADRLTDALHLLERHGLLSRMESSRQGPGRREEVWASGD